jgi:VWFA-related protein
MFPVVSGWLTADEAFFRKPRPNPSRLSVEFLRSRGIAIMRTFAIVVLSLCFALPSFAAKRVTVDELAAAVAAMSGKSDADVADHIAELELSERLSDAQYARLASTLPGAKSRQALQAIADVSAFQDPPATEIPARPTPTFAEQRQMMGQVVHFVSKVIPELPNFLATRTTLHFEDTPLLQRPGVGTSIPYEPLHEVGEDTAKVTYRDGHEVVERVSQTNENPLTRGLQTEGIFGAFLGRVLVDAAQSTLKWGHWEKGAHDEAVFVFEVPKVKSHYEVDYCCVTEQTATAAANVHLYRKVVNYRGEMAIDPASGAILRLVVQAELDGKEPITQSAILVEYGPVEIGDKPYICPLRSVTLLTGQAFQMDPNYKYALANEVEPLKTVLNEASYSQYHVFRSEARIVTAEASAEQSPLSAEPAAPVREGEATGAEPSAGAAAQPETAQTAPEPAKETAQSAAAVTNATDNTEMAAAQPETVPAKTGEPADAQPEVSLEAATKLPDEPQTAAQSDSQSRLTLRTTSRLVDVGVVAFDKKGTPVTDLKPEDFEIYDNGVKQDVRFFSRAGEKAADKLPEAAQESAPERGAEIFTNRDDNPDTAAAKAEVMQSHATILMLDATGLGYSDLNNVREEMLRFLKNLPADERVGLYVITGAGFKVLEEPTADKAELAGRLRNWIPNAHDLTLAQEDEARNRQQIDEVHKIGDLNKVNGHTDPMDPEGAQDTLDPQLQTYGRTPGLNALFTLVEVARHLATLPGHKSLIWVSSDNVLANWSDQTASITTSEGGIAAFGERAAEALNDAHVSVYPLDASQLEGGAVDASLQHRNVELNQIAKDNAGLATSGQLGASNSPDGETVNVGRDMTPGRLTAAMKQDIRPIEGTVQDLAKNTGGRTLRRAGDIAGELNGIVADGRAAYLLSFAPSLPADDKYHTITVKVKDAKGIRLRYRAGYLATKEQNSLKARFHEAIWAPQDASGIGLHATPGSNADGGAIKLNIAGTDLELEQHGGRWMDDLDIFLVERDETDQHAKVSGQRLGLRLLPGTYQKVLADGVNFEQHLDGRPKGADLRIVVVDENSWRIGTVTIPSTYWVARAGAGKGD